MNTNESCYVKLTEYGKQIAQKDCPYVREIGNGWSEWQLWVLMSVFGKYHYLGNRFICFEKNQVLFEKPE